jgi:hypothetical protein
MKGVATLLVAAQAQVELITALAGLASAERLMIVRAKEEPGLESRLSGLIWDSRCLNLNRNPRFTGVFKADEGTRTLDLLHGKCERTFAPVRARSLNGVHAEVS